ncbi:MAG: MoxR family ATPase [Rhodospirillaceae bacterium]|nr:MoxR family ATPase [Rhodospirillaceae bacterium]
MFERKILSSIQAFTSRIRENVQNIIVGKQQSIDMIAVALLCRGHVLIEDVPGTGKTTLAKALAASLDYDFRRVQFTPDLVPADLIGFNAYVTETAELAFKPGPIFSQILLADEINRATPRTQSALLEAMQERQVSVDGATMDLPQPFIVLATLNPVEMEGTFPLPEAQLDRFLLRVSMGYPSREEGLEMLERFHGRAQGTALNPVADAMEIAALSDAVSAIHVEPMVREYILTLVERTRAHEAIRLGISPRGALALQLSAQAWAGIAGRDHVLPDDVKAMSIPVLGHRLILDASAELRGQTSAAVLAEILSETPVPLAT